MSALATGESWGPSLNGLCSFQLRLFDSCDLLRSRSAVPAYFNTTIVALLLLVGQRFSASGAAGEAGEISAARRTVLILGDSLAAGYGVEPEVAFPTLLQRRLDEAKLTFTVVNAGQSGDTSAGGLRRITWLLRRPVDVLVLELGGNDGLRGIQPSTTHTNLQRIIVLVKEKFPEVKVVIAGMRMPESMGSEFAQEFQQVFLELAKANEATLIPFLLEGVAGDPKFNQPDLIHPNADGHRIVARNVWEVLGPILIEIAAQKPDKRDASVRP